MGEIIRTWLRTRLGVIIDLSPEIFGHYARDGTLLAKILHNYDIINDSQLHTLNRTQDPALSRVNLKNLRIWLRFIGVDCDDECTEDISNGKGTTALRLFYKVYLALESKDSLHFITLQKEREKFIPNSSKFDVTTVSEEPEPEEPEDHPLAGPLRKGASLIEWERKKYNRIIEDSKGERKKFRISQERNDIWKPSPETVKTATRRTNAVLEEEKRELDEFARKHRVEESKELLKPCDDIPKFQTEKPKIHKANHEAAKAYTKSLKRKYRQEAMTKSFKTRMQKALISEVWEKVVSDQEMEFDELIARKVLNQSQYEKKMMRKLCDIRNEKARMAGNRQIVEELSQRTKEQEERLEQERAREVLVRESEEVEAERRRMNELERRINEDTARRKKQKLRTIGKEVVNDLVDISAKAAEYKIASNDNNLPKSLWNEWKALFVKSQPIFAAVDEDIQREIKRDELEAEEIGEETDDADVERADVLNDDDFENYHNLRSPWNDFVSNVDIETRGFLNLGLTVLGYIVHKVLESLYPRSEEPVEPPLPKMEIKATVLGIPDSLLYKPIRELLKHSRIHLVCVEDAINYCLEQYKEEMKDYEYIDLNIVTATRQSFTRQSSGSAGERGMKLLRKEKKSASSGVKTAPSTKRFDQARSGIDKVTQTPRVIPYEDMDPTLSDTAYIGKWTHEFLTLGQPLSDDLNARILLEYLKSLKDVQGFVLINYPTTYEQMTSLEFALSGRRLPENRYKLFTGEEEMNIEEIDPVNSRITFEAEGYDSLDLLRRSRLVPDPLELLESSDGNSYFTAFVTIKPKPKKLERSEVGEYEFLPDDRTSLEAFYVDQEIASVLYYTIFDLPTLKRLARVLITGGTSLPRIASEELFGEAMEYFVDRSDENSSLSKAPIFKKLLSRPSVSSFGESGASEWTERSDQVENEVATSRRSKEDPPSPGEPEWSWANLPQPLELAQGLATLWQSLETSYIENLKDMFQLKRTNFGAIVPYTNFVKRHMKEFIERPDRKQDLLHEFHRAFNDIDEDIREDMETKRELHCRVADFEILLWDVCNDRRKEAEEERKRIILDHWTTQEAIILTNVYIGIVQAEIDRCADTLQFIQDYYLAMLRRPLQEVRQSRVLLQRIPLETQTSGSKQDIVSMKKLSSKSLKEKESKETRAKASSVKISSPPSSADENLFDEEIAKLLTNVQEENFDPTQTICYKSIEANIHYVQTIAEAMATSVLDILKKEEIAASKSPVEPKEKKGSSRKVSRASRTEQGSARKQAQDLVLEWRYALMFEINRIRLRLKMLDAAARSDINFLVDVMQRLFFGIHEQLVDRYKSEVKSVNLMASTFRFAVEEAIPIQEEMLLDGDRFLVRSNVLMYPDKPAPESPPTREEMSPSNFQMTQLGRLIDIFRHIAPCGTLAERSFVYILQDLIACGDEEGGTSSLPSCWLQLRACDVPRLVSDIYGAVQFVDWREFIIYAMDIEMPSVDQLLDALEAFRHIDENSTDTVSCEEFHSVGLWFFDWNDTDAVYSSSLLHENFERDEDEMEEKEETIAFNCALDKRRKSAGHSSNEKSMKPESIMRLTLAKELLCEMFLSKDRRVNYVALLLAFCKDEEPKGGLGKALSVAIGNKICVDWKEGEKYVEELLEKRRRAAEDGANRKYLHEEATLISKAMLNAVLKGVLRNSKADASRPVEELATTKYDNIEVERVPIRIEKLDGSGVSVVPSDLLSSDDNTPISSVSDADRAVTPEEIETHVPRVTITLPEDCAKRKRAQAGERELVHWLNIEVCQAVLAAMLPRLATQPDLFESSKSLRENLQSVCLELRDEELNDEAEEIFSHRFLDHSFVNKVILDTSIFTTRHLGNVVDKILHENK